MSSISSNYLQRMCDPIWVAKAYSEYMLDCANTQSNMIESMSSLCNDQALSDLVDQYSDTLTDNIAIIQSLVEKRMPELYPNVMLVPEDFVKGSDKWIATVDDINTLYNPYWPEYFKAKAEIVRIDSSIIGVNSDGEFLSSQSVDAMLGRCEEIRIAIENAVVTYLDANNYNADSIYTLDEGFTNMKDLMINYIHHSLLSVSDPIKLNMSDANGVSSISELYLDEITESMKSSFASCIAWGFAFDAIRENTVSDAVTKFDALISTVISDTTEKFSSIVNTARSVLTSHINSISTFFSDAGEMLGWNAVLDDSFQSVDQTDVYSYTGASPLGAVNLNSAKGLASAVGKTVAAVGAGIFSAAKSLLGKVWAKAKPFVMSVTNNPVDIAIEDDKDESYACSNFKYSLSDYLYFNYTGNLNSIANMIVSHSDSWYAIKTIFGEITFKLNYVPEKSDASTFCLKVDLQCRISNMSYRKLLEFGIATKTNEGTNEEHVSIFSDWNVGIAKFDQLIQCGDYRPSNDEDEAYLYMGFIFSILLQSSLGDAAALEIGNQVYEKYQMKVNYIDYKYNNDSQYIRKYPGNSSLGYYVGQGRVIPSNVTNLDFLKATSGFRESAFGKTNSFETIYEVSFPGPGATPINEDQPLLLALSGFILSFVYQQYDKFYNPTDYMFLPYCKGTYAFSGGRYRIKTDAENANVATFLANAIVTVVIVALAVVLCRSITKVFKVKRMASLRSKLGVLDSSMWGGSKLSTRQAVKYQRYTNRLSKLENISSGFVGSGSKLTSITQKVTSLSDFVTNNLGIDPVQSMVQGQLVSSTNGDTKDLITLIKGTN